VGYRMEQYGSTIKADTWGSNVNISGCGNVEYDGCGGDDTEDGDDKCK